MTEENVQPADPRKLVQLQGEAEVAFRHHPAGVEKPLDPVVIRYEIPSTRDRIEYNATVTDFQVQILQSRREGDGKAVRQLMVELEEFRLDHTLKQVRRVEGLDANGSDPIQMLREYGNEYLESLCELLYEAKASRRIRPDLGKSRGTSATS